MLLRQLDHPQQPSRWRNALQLGADLVEALLHVVHVIGQWQQHHHGRHHAQQGKLVRKSEIAEELGHVGLE